MNAVSSGYQYFYNISKNANEAARKATVAARGTFYEPPFQAIYGATRVWDAGFSTVNEMIESATGKDFEKARRDLPEPSAKRLRPGDKVGLIINLATGDWGKIDESKASEVLHSGISDSIREGLSFIENKIN